MPVSPQSALASTTITTTIPTMNAQHPAPAAIVRPMGPPLPSASSPQLTSRSPIRPALALPLLLFPMSAATC